VQYETHEAFVNHRLDAEVEAVSKIAVVPAILDVICKVTGMGFAAVARVTEDRWIACAVKDDIDFGLEPGGELEIRTTICNEVRREGRLVTIDHVAEDPHYRDHQTPRMYGFQSYISVPIRLSDGRFFGTLCAMDPRPAQVRKPEVVTMFELFANLIAVHLDAQQRLATSETALSDERHRTELQDQFIAVLGHDLRNPLSAIQTGAKVLLTMAPSTPVSHVATVIDRSASRITGIVDNVLDFAQGRLGGGLTLHRVAEERLGAALEQGGTEMRVAGPEGTIHSHINLPGPIYCDGARLAQLLSNLLANALTHGDPNTAVSVRGVVVDGAVEVSVSNGGAPIPPERLEGLFEPFVRASERPARKGLGLGLYIADQIARGHDGALSVVSTPVETRFTFRMPAL